jgi:Na+-driven multidrug efflux pump
MTEGPILKHILDFAVPLFIGNLLQQLYNMVDMWVVGNYVNNEAYSAVGTVGPVTSLMIGFFTGLAGGAGVVIAQYYGAKQEEKVTKELADALATYAENANN